MATALSVYSRQTEIYPRVSVPRELGVLKLIAAGRSNKLIAAELPISEETVKGYVKNILAKLRASDRTHAVTVGLKRGTIEL
ncbi:MAG: LuxR C-terminal-related transcriptional regulator [Rhizobium sp.]|nr:LuxR C-terminal-related transcriptional regulator [Rhizobium sp.]